MLATAIRHDMRIQHYARSCVLRDRLPVDGAVSLGAQLVLVRGFYYEAGVGGSANQASSQGRISASGL
jgi:hypothetical protein